MHCSRGIAFVLNALRYLASDGELVCVLPAGSLQIQKDARAWAFLRAMFHSDVISRNGHRTFLGCVVSTVIVRLRPRDLPLQARQLTTDLENPGKTFASVTLYRGKLPMCAAGQEKAAVSVPVVHSTSLRNYSVNFKQFETGRAQDTISGPVVLLPRVGKPNKSKVVLYKGRCRFVMSDCVLGLRCWSNLERVHSLILKEWSSISRLYAGTGAKFLRVAAIARVLRRLGIKVNAPEGRHFSRQLAQQIYVAQRVLDRDELEAIASEICKRNGNG